MSTSAQISTNPLIAKIHQLFSRDLALENDFLRQENRILRSKLPTRVAPHRSRPAGSRPIWLAHQGSACGGYFHRQARNSSGLEPPPEAKEMDLQQRSGKARTTSQIGGHRSLDCSSRRTKQLVGLQTSLRGAEETRPECLPQLHTRRAPASRPASGPQSQRPFLEAIPERPPGGHLGDGFLYRRGLDLGWTGYFLCPVLPPLGHSSSLVGWLHST